ncbi:unnamed protein product [Arctogadus glacialis]
MMPKTKRKRQGTIDGFFKRKQEDEQAKDVSRSEVDRDMEEEEGEGSREDAGQDEKDDRSESTNSGWSA